MVIRSCCDVNSTSHGLWNILSMCSHAIPLTLGHASDNFADVIIKCWPLAWSKSTNEGITPNSNNQKCKQILAVEDMISRRGYKCSVEGILVDLAPFKDTWIDFYSLQAPSGLNRPFLLTLMNVFGPLEVLVKMYESMSDGECKEVHFLPDLDEYLKSIAKMLYPESDFSGSDIHRRLLTFPKDMLTEEESAPSFICHTVKEGSQAIEVLRKLYAATSESGRVFLDFEIRPPKRREMEERECGVQLITIILGIKRDLYKIDVSSISLANPETGKQILSELSVLLASPVEKVIRTGKKTLSYLPKVLGLNPLEAPRFNQCFRIKQQEGRSTDESCGNILSMNELMNQFGSGDLLSNGCKKFKPESIISFIAQKNALVSPSRISRSFGKWS
eukprot:Gregarina_sp_Poly_1__4053@NODE_2228_length_2457_cov_7_954393_g1224_i1_p1_GENE_NODE_2228_length_2457_cov_7_954393_g1224_i1NODE_2228_length_2457_cov_7_954393_g1224_i1_p1_ORF_typecomplete_len389_score36_41_NODE_2228_length_2457_cov_7_954393_g1224_i18211987